MSGILDSKTRIIDAFITDEGKRQISTGKLKIEFAAFTDRHTFYAADAISGSSDASTRLYFEANTTAADQVTFETDDSGALLNNTGGDLRLIDGILVDATGAFVTEQFANNQSLGFASLSSRLISSSSQNFKRLQFLGTDDPFFGKKFNISKNKIFFTITDEAPLGVGKVQSVDLENIRPLFFDERLGLSNRFKYLEPILPITGSDGLGNPSRETVAILKESIFPGEPATGFIKLNARDTIQTLQDLMTNEGIKQGPLNTKPYHEVMFSATSRDNNIVMQMFEIGAEKLELKKLDVIDFGEFLDESGRSTRVFFAGKVIVDEVGSPSYINLFTLVLD